MKLLAAIVFMLLPLTALAADEPEAVYAKFHRAVMSGNVEEMIKYGPTPRRAEMYAMSEASREAALKMAQYMMPRAFTLRRKTMQPNGRATLIVGGPWTGEGKTETMYGVVRMVTENGEWKVDEASWSNQPPPNLAAPQPAAPPAAAAKAPSNAAASVKGAAAATAAPVVGTMSSEPPARKFGQARPECVYKPVMTAQDLENCK